MVRIIAAAFSLAFVNVASFKVFNKESSHTSRSLKEAVEDLSFDEYLSKHSKTYHGEEYHLRRKVFEDRQQKVKHQNQRSNKLWTATLNVFSDRTEEELKQYHGWKPSVRHQKGMSFSQQETFQSDSKTALPQTADWRNLTAAKTIPEQGSCGSCWAVSAVQILNAHYEIRRGQPRSFSVQELVDCVPNPDQCGGTGGCEGATVELGLAWATAQGLSDESEVPYTAKDGRCTKIKSFLQHSSQSLRASHSHSLFSGNAGASFGLLGFKVLPSNKEEPLSRAVAELGPVAVSVAADNWFSYYGGIFDSCDTIVNHAVTCFGYGVENGKKYWLIKNSWGRDWGEDGYIRLLRHEKEDEFCGIDTDPSKGIACKGGPSQVTVCGSCGVLYDSVVPQFDPAPGASFLDTVYYPDANRNSFIQETAPAHAAVTAASSTTPAAVDKQPLFAQTKLTIAEPAQPATLSTQSASLLEVDPEDEALAERIEQEAIERLKASDWKLKGSFHPESELN
jgi:cathepsin L